MFSNHRWKIWREKASKLEVIILGSNSAIPVKGRHPSAQLLRHESGHFLIDCGEGTQIRFIDLGLKMSKVNVILISHLHGDHFFGLPGLLSTYNLQGRTRPLQIIGPEGIKSFIQTTFNYSKAEMGYQLTFKEVNAEDKVEIWSDDLLTISAIPLKHGTPTNGYLFEEKPGPRRLIGALANKLNIPNEERKKIKEGADFIDEKGQRHENASLTIEPKPARRYAYCSDTIFNMEIVKWVRGFNLLFHEATYKSDLEREAQERMHTTAGQAAMIAKAAKVGKLLIGHFSSRYQDLNDLLNEARSVFPSTFLAEEGHLFEV